MAKCQCSEKTSDEINDMNERPTLIYLWIDTQNHEERLRTLQRDDVAVTKILILTNSVLYTLNLHHFIFHT